MYVKINIYTEVNIYDSSVDFRYFVIQKAATIMMIILKTEIFTRKTIMSESFIVKIVDTN